MGEELALSGKLVQEGSTWAILLDDGQRLLLQVSPHLPIGSVVTLVVTTPSRFQQGKQELAHHLLAEILNGS